jgi:hypothetical protein
MILTAALTKTSIDSLIVRQIFVVIVMIAVGYFIGLRNTKPQKKDNYIKRVNKKSNLKLLLVSFLPIIVTVVLNAAIGIDIAISTLIGVIVIIAITRTSAQIFKKTLKNKAVWEVALAAFGAMLLKNVTVASGASEILGNTLASTNMDPILLISIVSAVVAFLIGSTSGAIALSVPILAETVAFVPKTASLLYIQSYLGYMIAPTHLCIVFTAQYFKSSINSSFKYLLPATAVSMAAAILTYFIM